MSLLVTSLCDVLEKELVVLSHLQEQVGRAQTFWLQGAGTVSQGEPTQIPLHWPGHAGGHRSLGRAISQPEPHTAVSPLLSRHCSSSRV